MFHFTVSYIYEIWNSVPSTSHLSWFANNLLIINFLWTSCVIKIIKMQMNQVCRLVRSLSSLVSVTSSSLTLINDNFYRNRVRWTWLIVRNQIFCSKCLPLPFISFFNSEPGTDKLIVCMVTMTSAKVKSEFLPSGGTPHELYVPLITAVPPIKSKNCPPRLC